MSGASLRANNTNKNEGNKGFNYYSPPRHNHYHQLEAYTKVTKLPQIIVVDAPTSSIYNHITLSPVAMHALQSISEDLFRKDALRSPEGGRRRRSVGKSSLKSQVQSKERKLEVDINRAENGIDTLIAMAGRSKTEIHDRDYILNELVPRLRASLAISRRAIVKKKEEDRSSSSPLSCELLRRMSKRLNAAFSSVLCVTSSVADEMARLLG